MQGVRQFQIFFDGCDLVIEATTFLFEVLKSVPVGANTLFKADQNIGEFFQGRPPRQACLLYMLACSESQCPVRKERLVPKQPPIHRSEPHAKITAMQHLDETVTTARLLSVAVDACKSAGGLLRDYAKSGFQIEHKQAIDLVRSE